MEYNHKAVIAGVNLKNKETAEEFADSMEELKNLAAACDIKIIGEISQKASRVNTARYFGKGKLDELAVILDELDAELVIFNDELTASQIRNIEKILSCKVIDRTVLILDIFAQRAKTKEAQLQVEVAKLQYVLPRLGGQGISMSRQGGGSGLSNRGAGETKLELDRRKIEDRISGLNKELEDLVARRKNQRAQRIKKELPVVALVGYTNAGKSTIMNAMMNVYNATADKQVFEKDMLFATLETSVRSITLPDSKTFLLTDTVGFISKLPHHLVKAFRSTLEEVAEADLLIHVVDYSNPNFEKQINVTNETLKALGVNEIPVVYAFNKTDLLDVESLKDNFDRVYISAKRKVGIDRLVNAIRDMIFTDYVHCKMLIPFDKGNIVSYLNDNANVKETTYESDGIIISLECKESDFQRYQEYVV